MAYKATKSFSGVISMKKGDVRDITNEEVAKDLLRAGYVIELADESKPEIKPVKKATSKKASKKDSIEDGDSNG